MWYTLDQDNLICLQLKKEKKKKKSCCYGKTQKAMCTNTGVSKVYTDDCGDPETFRHKHKSIQNKYTGKYFNSLMLLNQREFALRITRCNFFLGKKNIEMFTKKNTLLSI